LADVFISFIHEEEPWAADVRMFIQRVLSRDPFMSSDKRTIYAGEDWMQRIFEELKDCKVLISMLSPVSITRPWINFEAGAAWMNDDRYVIPICYNGLTIEALPKPYSSLQAIDLGTFEGMHYLVSSIAHYLGIKEPEKPLFPPWNAVAKTLSGMEKPDNDSLLVPYRMLDTSLRLRKLS
jgi:hypothetical protein